MPETNGQRLQELLTRTAWEPGEMDRMRIRHISKHASVGGGVVIVDDTGFAKKGRHSVGVARQYSGTLGRVDNCQVLVSTHYVDRVFDWPITARLYLRWVIERFYQDAKGELGLDDYEGRLWCGPHRHVALVMLAHSYLTLRQSYGAQAPGRDPPHTSRGLDNHTPPPRGFPPTGSKEHRRTASRSHRGALHAGHQRNRARS